MPNVNIDLSDDDYERLHAVKDAHGLTWRGLMLQGATAFDTDGPLPDAATDASNDDEAEQ